MPLLFPNFSIEELEDSIDCYIDYYNNERLRNT
ncbi:MAG: IS3 family transposase [Clostridia bacterium]|nr:IS3 family transposase [Clostridia bacterium]